MKRLNQKVQFEQVLGLKSSLLTDEVSGVSLEMNDGQFGFFGEASGNGIMFSSNRLEDEGGGWFSWSLTVDSFVKPGKYYMRGLSVRDRSLNLTHLEVNDLRSPKYYDGTSIPVFSFEVVP